MEMSESRDDIAEKAKDVLETLLDLMGISATVVPLSGLTLGEGEATATGITLDIKGEDLGILIGRRGQTLSCLQYIVRLIVGNQTKEWLPIIIDIEGYKQRRYNALQALALRMAEQVKAKGVPFTLEPMPAFDRRIIHLALAENPDVTTQSSGEGEERKVVVLPREHLA
jgi:spoIIIJ-associated protein